MDFKEKFYQKLRRGFLEKDYEELDDLWLEMDHQIDRMRQEGLSEEEMLDNLGSPEEIIDDFYEDQKFETAMHAEKVVIPEEELKKVYKEKQRNSFNKKIDLMKRIAQKLFLNLFLLIDVYFASYFIVELLREKHISYITLILTIALTLCLFINRLHTKKRKIIAMCALFLTSFTLILLIAQKELLFYSGSQVDQKVTISPEKISQLSVDSNLPLTVTIIPTSSKNYSMELTGKMPQSAKLKVNEREIGKKHQQFSVNMYKIYSIFTKYSFLELMIHVPEKADLTKLNLDLACGYVEISQLNVNKLNVNIHKGSLLLDKTHQEKVNIQTVSADIISQNQTSKTIEIGNEHGKTIIKENKNSQISIESTSGFSSIQDSASANVNITNKTGKIAMIDSKIQSTTLKNNQGEILVLGQQGKTMISNNSGKIVIKNMEGELHANNETGATILTQSVPLSGNVASEKGIIKWIQNDSNNISFDIINLHGTTKSDFTKDKTKKYQVKVSSDSGDIKIINDNTQD